MDPRPPAFKFEAGPSLYSGFSPDRSPNPLKHVYQMIGEEPEWITYDKWGAYLPEAPEGYELSIGAENFLEILRRTGANGRRGLEQAGRGAAAAGEGRHGRPVDGGSRNAGVLATLALRYPGPFLNVVGDGAKNSGALRHGGPAVAVLRRRSIPRNYPRLDRLSPTRPTGLGNAHGGHGLHGRGFLPGRSIVDFPRGGSRGLVEALARGVTKRSGCDVRRSTTVERVVVEDGRAVGVELRGGKTIRARKGVVSNADLRTPRPCGTGRFSEIRRGARRRI